MVSAVVGGESEEANIGLDICGLESPQRMPGESKERNAREARCCGAHRSQRCPAAKGVDHPAQHGSADSAGPHDDHTVQCCHTPLQAGINGCLHG